MKKKINECVYHIISPLIHNDNYLSIISQPNCSTLHSSKIRKKRTVSLENTEDLASCDALNLSDTVRVTKNHTDL